MFISDERIIREKERLLITGVSRSAWYNMVKRGHAPEGINLSIRSVGWRYSDILKWMKSLESTGPSKKDKGCISNFNKAGRNM